MGRATNKEWRHQGSLPVHANTYTQSETKHQKMTGDEKLHREGQRRGQKGDGDTNNVRQEERGCKKRQEMAEEPGNPRREHRRAAESIYVGGWTPYHAGIRWGEGVI